MFQADVPQGMSGYRPNGGTATAQVVAREDDDVKRLPAKNSYPENSTADDVGYLADIVLLP